MNRKLTFFLIALVGIGLYALPSTTALFAGQHSFVNIDATGNQIDCEKCHGDVKAELGGQGSTVTGTNGPHENFECAYCHRIEAGASSGDNAYALITYVGEQGADNRYLAISLRDMEEMNYPDKIVVNATSISGLKDSSRPGYRLSPVTPGFETNDTFNLSKNYDGSVKIISTYDPTTGEPVDIDEDTRWGGMRLSESTSWDYVPGYRPYYVPNMTGVGSEAVNPGSAYHAASLVSCMECHGGADHGGLAHYSRLIDGEIENADNSTGAACSNCHYGPVDTHNYVWREFDAGGFGLTVDNPDDTGVTEAHNEFVKQDDGLTRYGGSSLTNDTALYASNGACVACHTHVKVDITYTKPETLAFAVDMTGTDSVEALDNFSSNGAVVSHSSGV